MYQGFVESDERIAERKARILKDYVPEPAPEQTEAEDQQGES